MANMISLDTIFDMLKPLSSDSKRWLADKLYNEIAKEKKICELDKALEEAHNASLYRFDNVKDTMKALME